MEKRAYFPMKKSRFLWSNAESVEKHIFLEAKQSRKTLWKHCRIIEKQTGAGRERSERAALYDFFYRVATFADN
jgi:hypothetical protein